jgi:hypothetical protein
MLGNPYRVVQLGKKILSPNPTTTMQPPAPSSRKARKAPDRRCFCNRCHGKTVCKSTFYMHNPPEIPRRDRSRASPQGTVDTGNSLTQGAPSLNTSAPGPSTSVTSEDGPGPDPYRAEAAGPDSVRVRMPTELIGSDSVRTLTDLI